MFPWTSRTPFWQPCWKIFDGNPRIFAHCPKMIKNIIFSEKLFLRKMFLWARRMQFEQPCWKFFLTESRKLSLDVQKIITKNTLFPGKISFKVGFFVACFQNGKEMEIMLKKQFFQKKNKKSILCAFPFWYRSVSSKKASLPKWEGAKNAGGSWPTCLGYFEDGKTSNRKIISNIRLLINLNTD